MTSKNNSEKTPEIFEGKPLHEVFAAEELAQTQAKLDTAVTFLRWLASTSKGDWDLRQRTIRTLREIGAWAQ